ncbi:hypothetical protein HHK36_005465 [Tetracentron sinense]|uniref:Uncharacterized protein n=1 Tax=Tetracentron sinense TaxID=13715 RepID=A0A834ZPH3_TETSI|nr:hypothetical protein HHK36_005465 [Tetracentron sinense]
MPQRHSKNNNDLAFFTYDEKRKLGYGTQKERLGRDSIKPFDACSLCLKPFIDPLCCQKGHVFCKECILECLLAQKKDIQRENSWFFLSFLLICFSLNTHLSIGADTISAGQSLSGNQTIISDGGNFVLGFFTPGKSQNHYIGIWYNKVSVRTIVWVANRDRPLSDPSSSELKIMDGNLILLNQSKFPIWSTNLTSATLNSIKAALLDTGNLVLRDGPNSSTLVSESLDHPTHTCLPGGKLGLDKRTNKTQRLTSWRSEEDPAPGFFSLELDPSGTNQYLILWNGSENYWTSGVWNGQIFSLVPEMRLNYIYNFSYINNENESYFTYSVYNTSILSRFIMELSGQVKQLSWLEKPQQWNLFWAQPRKQCEVHALCGAFSRCNERALPFCEFGSSEGCELACLNNCSCTAYAYGSNGCSIWVEDLLNLQQFSDDKSDGNDLYNRLAASEISSSKKGTATCVGTVAGAVALLGFLLVLIWGWQRRRPVGTSKAVEDSLVPFGYRDLQSATKNFSEKLGGGGFGSVFKGTLPDSTVIAVKKL